MADPSPNQPQADERTFTEENFGAELFWEQHKALILGGIATVLIAALGIVFFFVSNHNTKLEGAAALAAATTSAELKEVADKFSGTPAASSAQLLIARDLRQEGSYETSTTLYQSLSSEPFAAIAQLGPASNALAENNPKEAEALLSALELSGSQDAAPTALLLLATQELASGQLESAKAHLESITTEYPQSIPALVAPGRLQQIAKVLPEPAAPKAEN